MSNLLKKNLSNLLKQVPIFAHLSPNERLTLTETAMRHQYEKNHLVFVEGDTQSSLYIVLSGSVKIYKTSTAGKEQIIHIHKPLHLFAEVAVFSEQSMPINCMTLEKTTLLEIPKEAVLTLIQKYPSVALKMLAMQAQRLRLLTQKIENLSLKDSNQRLIHYLLAQVEGKREKSSFILTISRTTLALILGISRENLSRLLKKLAVVKLIHYNRQTFTLLDIPELKRLCNTNN